MALLLACSDKIEQSENSIKIYQSMWKDTCFVQDWKMLIYL